MNLSEKFYTEKLYPLQDGVIKIVKDLKLPFYLTGGTALSRFYFNHRYSDDLDFFVNQDSEFKNYIQSFSGFFNESNLNFKLSLSRTKIAENYAQFYIVKDDIELKVDFVNDLAVRFGEIIIDNHLGKVDSLRNILSNKISALYRFELKDYVDIWCIASNYEFNWKEIIDESKQKEISIDPVEIFNLFRSFPFDKLAIIKWIKNYDVNKIKDDFFSISDDILNGTDNSLIIHE